MADFGSLSAGEAGHHLNEHALPPAGSPQPAASGPLVAEIEQQQDAVVVRLRGLVGDIQDADLDAEFKTLEAARPSLVIIDLGGLAMLSLPILSALVSFRRELIRHNGRVVLAGLTHAQRRILSAAELNRVFPTVASVEIALARALRGNSPDRGK